MSTATLTQGKLPVVDVDGDLNTDPDINEERAEQITVGGQPADLTGYINTHTIAINDLSTLTLAMDVASLVGAAATLFLAPPVGIAAVIVTGAGLIGETRWSIMFSAIIGALVVLSLHGRV